MIAYGDGYDENCRMIHPALGQQVGPSRILYHIQFACKLDMFNVTSMLSFMHASASFGVPRQVPGICNCPCS